MSGTPFSNKLDELWSIYNVVSPATFGPKHVFEDLIKKPIREGQASGADASKVSAYKEKLKALRCTLSRLMLRRKVIVANVMTTSMQDLMVLCPLTPQQEWAYLSALNLPDYRLAAMFAADALLEDRGPLAEPELPPKLRPPLEVPLRRYLRDGTRAAHDEFPRSFGCPLWRLQHRAWPADVHESANTRKRRRARHAAADKRKKARKTAARDEDEDEDEDEEDENEDPRGGEDEDNCAGGGDGAGGNAGPQAEAAEGEPAPMWLPEHESDEEESDASSVDAGQPGHNRKLAAGAVVPKRRICGPHRERLYRTCGACAKREDRSLLCMLMPQIILLSALANHLDLARARPLEKVQSRAARRKHRDELRRAKLLLPAQDAALMPAGLRGENAHEYCVENRLDPFVRMAGQRALAQDRSQSGKLDVCMTLLTRWRNLPRCKVLLFSWSLTALNTLEALISSELADVELFRMDGSTPQPERERQKAAFLNAHGYCIFLISGGVGGTGLNLQQANKVIIFEPTFDPAMEQQVIGRAHRIGNQQDVKVYRLVSQGTVEELRYLRQIKKTAVSNVVLDGTTERRLFAEGELEGMAAFLDYSRVSLTERIKADYEARRARYAPRPDDATGDGAGDGAEAAPAAAAAAAAAEQFRQPQRALHEDERAGDGFRIVDAVEAAVPELQDTVSEQRKLTPVRDGVVANADVNVVATDATVEHGEFLEDLHDEDVIGAHYDIKELVGHSETELAYEKDLLTAAMLDMFN